MTTYWFDRSQQQGRIELLDRDRLDLLHRMSTNDTNRLKPGMGAATVLTTALARIIDQVIVYSRTESALMLTNQPQIVRNWLQRHIFFQDKVKLKDVSATLGQLELHGPHAAEIAETIAPGASGLELHHFLEFDGGAGLLARTFPMVQDGFVVIAAPERLLAIRQQAMQADVLEGDSAIYERLRIQAGLPGPNHELTENFIPLEANLWEAVSFTKGCYIGQEIIARMESRNKLAKTLVRLSLTDTENAAQPGAAIMAGERSIGTLTSLATLEDGSLVGLGFVKPEHAAPGTQLVVVAEQHQVPAVVGESLRS